MNNYPQESERASGGRLQRGRVSLVVRFCGCGSWGLVEWLLVVWLFGVFVLWRTIKIYWLLSIWVVSLSFKNFTLVEREKEITSLILLTDGLLHWLTTEWLLYGLIKLPYFIVHFDRFTAWLSGWWIDCLTESWTDWFSLTSDLSLYLLSWLNWSVARLLAWLVNLFGTYNTTCATKNSKPWNHQS